MLSLNHIRKHNVQSVLHLPCGDGSYTKLLAETGIRRIVGIDLDAGLIAAARQHTPEAAKREAGVEFFCGGLEQFEGENQFDLVLALGGFGGTRNPLSLLARMKALARHSVLGAFPKDSWYGSARRRVASLLRHPETYGYKPHGLEAFGNMAGFVRTEIHEPAFPGHDYLVAFYKTHPRESR